MARCFADCKLPNCSFIKRACWRGGEERILTTTTLPSRGGPSSENPMSWSGKRDQQNNKQQQKQQPRPHTPFPTPPTSSIPPFPPRNILPPCRFSIRTEEFPRTTLRNDCFKNGVRAVSLTPRRRFPSHSCPTPSRIDRGYPHPSRPLLC